MKKFFSLVLGVGLFLSSIAFSFATNQTDLTDISSHWARDTIQNLYVKGIIGGYPDNTYRPQNVVTTAEFLKLALEIADVECDYTGSPWYQQLMNKAFELGIIDDTIYNQPESPIQRKDVAIILAKLIEKTPDLRSEFITSESLDYTGYSKVVSDTHGLSEESQNSIYKLFGYGLITGSTNGEGKVVFQPEANLTRAEIAVIIDRLISPGKRVKLEKPETYQLTYAPRDFLESKHAEDYSSKGYAFQFDFENERLIFTNPDHNPLGTPHILKETFNPKLNQQVFDLARVLIEENNYINIFNAHGHKNDRNRVIIHFSPNINQSWAGNHYFSFVFYETEGFNNRENYLNANKEFSNNAALTLSVGKLFDLYSESGWINSFYARKLKDSMVVLFGENTGPKIFDFVIEEYLAKKETRSTEDIYKVRKIDGIQVDFYTGQDAIVYFAFTYLK